MENKRKNLLIISLHADPSMPPGVGEWGGTHTYMRELLTTLSNSAYKVILLTRKVYAQQKDMEKVSENCHIMRLTLGSFGDFDKRELYSLHETTFELTIIKLNEVNFIPDIIHSVYWNSGHLAMRLSKLWHIPFVHSVISNGRGRNEHGATGTAPNRIETEKAVFQEAYFILCVAESEKNELCKHYDIQANKIIVAGQFVHPAFRYPAHDSYGAPRKSGINYKIESEYYQPYSPSQSTICEWWNKKVFTYVGRLSLDKGIHFIFQAWHLLLDKYQDKCPPLWIIGGNPIDIEDMRLHLQIPHDELANLEETRKLIWWGYLDENGISAIYGRSLALITHSRYEPGGRVAVEAMCAELPVLATPNGFALDTICNWHNGFLIEYGDVESLAVRMEHFIKQPYLSNTMGYQAKKVSQTILFNWAFDETHIATYKAALQKLVKFTKPKKNMPSPTSGYRELHLYPFNHYLIDNPDIVQIMEENGIGNIRSVAKINISNSSSFFWEVTTDEKSYIVKIPYDRMCFDTLWSLPKDYPLIVTGLQRYRAEIGASSLNQLPILVARCDNRHALIQEKFISQSLSIQDQLDKVLTKIALFYKNNSVNDNEFVTRLDSMLHEKTDYKKIDKLYKDLSATRYPWQYHFKDYSLRVEIQRWKEYYDNLFPWQQQKCGNLFTTAYQEALRLSLQEPAYLPIFNHGGCKLGKLIFNPDAILVDNEKIHWGWPGSDYVDILTSYIEKNNLEETTQVWNAIVSKIPSDIISSELLIGWLLLDTCKKIVSEAACLNPVPQKLNIRIQSLLRLLK